MKLDILPVERRRVERMIGKELIDFVKGLNDEDRPIAVKCLSVNLKMEEGLAEFLFTEGLTELTRGEEGPHDKEYKPD
jgi:hypothetical protein